LKNGSIIYELITETNRNITYFKEEFKYFVSIPKGLFMKRCDHV